MILNTRSVHGANVWGHDFSVPWYRGVWDHELALTESCHIMVIFPSRISQISPSKPQGIEKHKSLAICSFALTAQAPAGTLSHQVIVICDRNRRLSCLSHVNQSTIPLHPHVYSLPAPAPALDMMPQRDLSCKLWIINATEKRLIPSIQINFRHLSNTN